MIPLRHFDTIIDIFRTGDNLFFLTRATQELPLIFVNRCQVSLDTFLYQKIQSDLHLFSSVWGNSETCLVMCQKGDKQKSFGLIGYETPRHAFFTTCIVLSSTNDVPVPAKTLQPVVYNTRHDVHGSIYWPFAKKHLVDHFLYRYGRPHARFVVHLNHPQVNKSEVDQLLRYLQLQNAIPYPYFTVGPFHVFKTAHMSSLAKKQDIYGRTLTPYVVQHIPSRQSLGIIPFTHFFFIGMSILMCICIVVILRSTLNT